MAFSYHTCTSPAKCYSPFSSLPFRDRRLGSRFTSELGPFGGHQVTWKKPGKASSEYGSPHSSTSAEEKSGAPTGTKNSGSDTPTAAPSTSATRSFSD